MRRRAGGRGVLGGSGSEPATTPTTAQTPIRKASMPTVGRRRASPRGDRRWRSPPRRRRHTARARCAGPDRSAGCDGEHGLQSIARVRPSGGTFQVSSGLPRHQAITVQTATTVSAAGAARSPCSGTARRRRWRRGRTRGVRTSPATDWASAGRRGPRRRCAQHPPAASSAMISQPEYWISVVACTRITQPRPI